MATFSRFATEETLSVEDVRDLIVAGKIAPTDLIARDGSSEWKRANEYEELRRFFAAAPRPRPVVAHTPLRHFDAKFTAPEPPSTLPLRFGGAWCIFIAFMIFSGGAKSGLDFLILSILVLAGVALIAFPAKIRELAERPAFRPRFASRNVLPFVIIGVVACVFVAGGIDQLVRETRSMSWPAANATVTRVWFDEDGTRGFSYRFELGRAKYWGKTYGQLVTGQAIRVRYNPDDPTDSVIGGGVTLPTVLMLVLPAVTLVLLVRQERRKRMLKTA